MGSRDRPERRPPSRIRRARSRGKPPARRPAEAATNAGSIAGASTSPAIMAKIHIAARIVAPWNSPPGAIEPIQKIWMPTRIPSGGSSRARETQHTVWVRDGAVPGQAAPKAVRRQRPDAEQCEQQHHHLEQRVDRAVRHQDGGDGIVEAGRREVFRCLRSQRRRGLGSSSTIAASPAVTRVHSTAAASRRTAPVARAVGQCLARAQSGARGDQQPAGHAAADRGLGQRHVRRG